MDLTTWRVRAVMPRVLFGLAIILAIRTGLAVAHWQAAAINAARDKKVLLADLQQRIAHRSLVVDSVARARTRRQVADSAIFVAGSIEEASGQMLSVVRHLVAEASVSLQTIQSDTRITTRQRTKLVGARVNFTTTIDNLTVLLRAIETNRPLLRVAVMSISQAVPQQRDQGSEDLHVDLRVEGFALTSASGHSRDR